MTTDKKIFNRAVRLRDSDKYEESIECFLIFIEKFPTHPKLFIVYFVIAGIYLYNIIDYNKSLFYAKKSKKLKSDYEPTSLTIYLASIAIEEHEKGIKEMISFLKKYKADLYKDTIEELLEGLEEGYMTNYKEQILDMAKRNNVANWRKYQKNKN